MPARLVEACGTKDTYAFHHVLVAEVAYQSLLVSQRRRLHARAARVLQDLDPERLEERAEVLAYHSEAAGEVEAALRFVLQAAACACRLCAFSEAIAHYHTALRLRGAGSPPARGGVSSSISAGPKDLLLAPWPPPTLN